MIRYTDGQATILVAHVLDGLAALEPESAQMGMTSPPYWGLRNYDTPPQHWGPTDCEHTWETGAKAGISGGTRSAKVQIKGEANFQVVEDLPYRQCVRCGAWQGHLGAEPNPDCLAWARRELPCHACFVCHMRTVFQALWPILRPDGTFWLNLADTYWGGKGQSNFGVLQASGDRDVITQPYHNATGGYGLTRPQDGKHTVIKPKELTGVPSRVALALQADGWYLRSDIIYAKPNPMPESVSDRPTRSHEYLFLLSKSEGYYYDAEAIKEKAGETTRRNGQFRGFSAYRDQVADGVSNHAERPLGKTRDGPPSNAGRNARSVWIIPTQGRPGNHYATFPDRLAMLPILAGSRPGDLVLDPFGGSGTVGIVARQLRRQCVLIELNPDYALDAWGKLKLVSKFATSR
jgi:DNA modification methylase